MKNNDLLLVIDMQNVYLPDQEWACPRMPEASRNTRRLIDTGVPGNILFTQFSAPENPAGRWMEYNREYREINDNAWLCAVTDEFHPYLKQYPLISKSTFSSLKSPEVLEAARRADRILLAGVVAECCVLATMLEAIDLGIDTIYMPDCCAGQTPEKEARVMGIADSFSPVHMRIQTVDEYLHSSDYFAVCCH